ncbi:uncharacterized protein LOC143671124 isoform X2 [Tamandua tetradactyla]|uniref:uncharacterized protein LOC143671124 isoform X2 n=1 Tax=Tamandua tetradactyla TaxID=48850 RepID=UPI004053E302
MKCLHSNNQSWFSRMNNQKKRKDMEPALPGVYCLKRKVPGIEPGSPACRFKFSGFIFTEGACRHHAGYSSNYVEEGR